MITRSVTLLLLALAIHTGAAVASADPPVKLTEDDSAFILDNVRVVARVDKRGGTFSLSFDGLASVTRGYWSQVGRSSAGDIARYGAKKASQVRTDPANNNGERAEVSCRFEYDGKSAGLPCDVDIRYALGSGDCGLYAYAIWTHRPGSPSFSVGEGRMALKLNPEVFDYLAIDANRHGVLPSGYDWDHGQQLNMKEVRRITTSPFAGRVEHKYDYSAVLADTPAYGWCSTRQHVGVWLINPSIEYLAGGPTKVELTGHLDVNPGGAPVLLNMWHGSHYGGSSLAVARDEAWTKCVGPFLVYCNAADSPEKMWSDAIAKAKSEKESWPYAWVSDPAYPPADERGTVKGTVTVSDPLAPKLQGGTLHIGLAAPGDWQRDSKHYQFWTTADARGEFIIRNIRPGSYTLHAFADGVLGDFRRPDVNISAGQTVDLGTITWSPIRYGRQLWEIGIPDRTAAEFRHGDHYWQWGLYYDYPKEFPDDVNFVIGKSDWRRDWNYCQPPRIEGTRVNPTTWTIRFDLPDAPRGKATLRVAICGSRGRNGIVVTVNGKPAGNTGPLPDTGVMHRDGIRGYWFERDVPFDASLLRPGENSMQLTNPARTWVDGVLYDYLRLELDEHPSR